MSFASFWNEVRGLLCDRQDSNQPVNVPAANGTSSRDEREAKCPYCQGILTKVPGSKTRCPNCGEHMYVRTTPENVRRVVTKEEADKIEEEWAIALGEHGSYLAEKAKIEKETELLRKKFGGREPSEHDVQWSLLNKEGITHARNRDWGLYRNTRLRMGQILSQEKKFAEALKLFWEVVYLDFNGPRNLSCLGAVDEETLRRFPSFDPSTFDPASGIYNQRAIVSLIKRTGIDRSVAEKDFLEIAARNKRALSLPLEGQEVWQFVCPALFNISQ